MPTITQTVLVEKFTVPRAIRVNIPITTNIAIDFTLWKFPKGYGNSPYGTSAYGGIGGYYYQATNATFKPVTFMRRP